MTRFEAFDDVKGLVEKFLNIYRPEYTSDDRAQIFELLDDVERLLKG